MRPPDGGKVIMIHRQKIRAFRRLAAVALAGVLAFAPAAEACTSFLLKAADGSPVYGRTMEFGFKLQSDAIVIPRQFAFTATGPGGKPGLTWKTRYGVVGLNAFGAPIVTDGLNEKGLAGGILYFPEYAGYADPAKADPAHALAPWEFLTWALTNFATVAEVRAAMDGISIIDVAEPSLGITPPVHYTLHDASGASLVIEPVGGALKVYDNPLGVMFAALRLAPDHSAQLREAIARERRTVNSVRRVLRALGRGIWPARHSRRSDAAIPFRARAWPRHLCQAPAGRGADGAPRRACPQQF